METLLILAVGAVFGIIGYVMYLKRKNKPFKSTDKTGSGGTPHNTPNPK